MRLIDADEAKKLKRMFTLKPSERMLFRLMLDRMPTYEPPNAPLTLKELREMGLFDWLWIEVVCPSRRQVFRKIESAYYQVFEDYTDGDALCCGWPGLIHEFEYEDYGKTWLAYRRKPEEGTVHEQ